MFQKSTVSLWKIIFNYCCQSSLLCCHYSRILQNKWYGYAKMNGFPVSSVTSLMQQAPGTHLHSSCFVSMSLWLRNCTLFGVCSTFLTPPKKSVIRAWLVSRWKRSVRVLTVEMHWLRGHARNCKVTTQMEWNVGIYKHMFCSYCLQLKMGTFVI